MIYGSIVHQFVDLLKRDESSGDAFMFVEVNFLRLLAVQG
jgi:hypothetical protein